MGVACRGPLGCVRRTPAGWFSAVRALRGRIWILEGGSKVPLGLVRGEDGIRGVTPPETEAALGEGA